jgi:hypothetical protein
VRRRSVSGREAFARNNEGGGVGAPVEEELNQDVDPQHAVLADVVVGETPYEEEDGKEDEADELEWLAADSVNGKYGKPVARNGSCTDENAVASGEIVELMVNSSATSIANCLENGGRV